MKSTMNHPLALSPEERRQLFADGIFKFQPQPITSASPRVWRSSQEKPSGACAHHSCWKPAAEGMKLCKHHRDLNIMRQRRFAEARRLRELTARIDRGERLTNDERAERQGIIFNHNGKAKGLCVI